MRAKANILYACFSAELHYYAYETVSSQSSLDRLMQAGPPLPPSHADDVTRRYHVARARTNRTINLCLMLVALLGTIVSSAVFIFLWRQEEIVLWLLWPIVNCLAAFTISAGGWITGKRVIDQWDDLPLH